MHCLYLNEISLGKLVLMMGEAKLIPFNIGELVLTASQDLRLSQPTLPSPKLALVWKRGKAEMQGGVHWAPGWCKPPPTWDNWFGVSRDPASHP